MDARERLVSRIIGLLVQVPYYYHQLALEGPYDPLERSLMIETLVIALIVVLIFLAVLHRV